MKHLRFRILASVSIAALSAAQPAHAMNFTEALEAAYDHHPRILAERQRLEQIDEGVSQALSNLRPTISAQYDYGKQRISFDSAPDSRGLYRNESLNLSQPLFRGGATWAGYHSAKQRVSAGRFRLQAVEQQVVFDAIVAYTDVVANRMLVDLAHNNQQALEKHLKATADRFKVGEVTRTDTAQSEARLSNAKFQSVDSEGKLAAAIAEFEHIVGSKPDSELAMPAQLPELPASLEEALERSRNQNPNALSARHEVKSANFDVDLSMAPLLPQVALVGSVSRQHGTGIFGASEFNQDRVGVTVSIPLYRSGSEYSKVRAAKSAMRERNHQLLDTQQTVIEQVTKAWEQLETTGAIITARQDQIVAAQASLDGVRQEQQAGSRTVLNVLDAEQELFSAQTALVQARRDRVIAAYALALHLGELTPQKLELSNKPYDPTTHYDSVKWQPIGF